MTTVQIIGVSVAGAAVLLLIVALLVTRHRHDDEQDEVRTGASFLDEAPQDTLSGLGKVEQPVEDITLDPAAERAAAEARAAAATEALELHQPPPGGLGLDWGPDLSVREFPPQPVVTPSWGEDVVAWGGAETGQTEAQPDETETTRELRPDEAEITGELRPDGPAALAEETAAPAPEGEGGGPMAASGPPRPQEAEPVADETAAEPGGEGSLVPLSDIIVTTSSKMVDLRDPDVRRMLTDLVTFEIDQAAEFRRQGQTIDAVLQLTEAEKVSRALGMAESAQRIRAMMNELRREG